MTHSHPFTRTVHACYMTSLYWGLYILNPGDDAISMMCFDRGCIHKPGIVWCIKACGARCSKWRYFAPKLPFASFALITVCRYSISVYAYLCLCLCVASFVVFIDIDLDIRYILSDVLCNSRVYLGTEPSSRYRTPSGESASQGRLETQKEVPSSWTVRYGRLMKIAHFGMLKTCWACDVLWLPEITRTDCNLKLRV